MKLPYFIAIAFLLAGCNPNTVEITGTAANMNGGTVSVTDSAGKTLLKEIIKSDKFSTSHQSLPANGYFTLSLVWGNISRDYEIYLEEGKKYNIDIPQKEWEYLNIKTESKTQNSLSNYYNLENSVAYQLRQENAMWNAKLKDPKAALLSDAEYNDIVERIASCKRREHGVTIAALDMFIKKYPDDDIVPHLISNMDYKADPESFYLLFKKLSPNVQNTSKGKQIGKELRALVK